MFLPQLIAIALIGLFYLLTLTEGLRKSGGLMRLPPHRFPPPSHGTSPIPAPGMNLASDSTANKPSSIRELRLEQKDFPSSRLPPIKVSWTQKKSLSVFHFRGELRPLKFAVKLWALKALSTLKQVFLSSFFVFLSHYLFFPFGPVLSSLAWLGNFCPLLRGCNLIKGTMCLRSDGSIIKVAWISIFF